MKNLILVFAILTSAAFINTAQAKQLELPLYHPDEVLLKALPWSKNAHHIQPEDLPESVQKTSNNEVQLAFEKGDGYYDTLTSAYYAITGESGEIVGYLEAALLSYTEDDDLYLVGAFITPDGRRLEADIDLNPYSRDPEDWGTLPPELHPNFEE